MSLDRFFRLVLLAVLSLALFACTSTESHLYKIKSCFRELNQVPVHSDINHYPLEGEFIDLRSEEGQKRLHEAREFNDYPHLASAYLTQSTQTFCGIASTAMVLNADESLLEWGPVSSPYKPFHFYTQCNVLNKAVYQTMSIRKILLEGMQLNEIHFVLTKQPSVQNVVCNHASSTNTGVADNTDLMPHHCSTENSLESFTEKVKSALKTKRSYVIANFSGMPNKERGGHFSPIAAYHEATDSFLIMDVSRYKFPPFWVTRKTLWEKMQTIDSGSGKSRGYIVVKTKGPLLSAR
jgi:hypothetical protein